jgi:DnaJ-class molecular chaperone
MYKIKECEFCKGKGYTVTQGTLYRFVRIKCYHCQGTGIIKTVIIDRPKTLNRTYV